MAWIAVELIILQNKQTVTQDKRLISRIKKHCESTIIELKY